MSKTIRKEKTRGWLDKLQKEKEARKQIREVRNYQWMNDLDYISLAEI